MAAGTLPIDATTLLAASPKPAETRSGSASATRATTARAPIDASSRTGWVTHRLRRWYLVARDVDRDDWRSFRVDRLHSVTASGPRFTPMDPPDAVEFVTRGASTNVYPYRARVRLAMSAVSAAERVAPATGIVVPIDELSCELTAGAASLEAIALNLALLGCDFEVLDPPALRDAVRALANRLLRGVGDAYVPWASDVVLAETARRALSCWSHRCWASSKVPAGQARLAQERAQVIGVDQRFVPTSTVPVRDERFRRLAAERPRRTTPWDVRA